MCRLACTNGDGMVKHVVVWGQDAEGRLVCHSRPHGLSYQHDAVSACRELLDEHCQFAAERIETELSAVNCASDNSFPYQKCYTVYQYEIERKKLHWDSLVARPDEFPECDMVIDYQ